jgi:pyridoxal phosphate enzyme (YggS family)
LDIEDNVKHFLQELPKNVTLIAVTKTVDVDRIKVSIKAGVTDIGENKVQEALSKYSELKDFNLKWHLIGSLQTNKVKKAVQIFDLIHSVDTLKLAEVIDKESFNINKMQDVLLQVNVSKEETKSGFEIENLFEVLSELSKLKNIRVRGLMTIANNTQEEIQIRDCFKKLRNLKEEINNKAFFENELTLLSMGMTNDYKIAISEGASMVRLGRAIFGNRN